MKCDQNNLSDHTGFSLVELVICMLITLVIMAAAVAVFSGALSVRERESGRTDAITSAQAALSVMSREIGNSGYGLSDNGLVIADCGEQSLRFRANVDNSDGHTSSAGEDVVYLFDSTSQSVVRYDRNTDVTSGIINRVSDVEFEFHNYSSDGTSVGGTTAASNTGRVTITLSVILPDVQGQPAGRIEKVESDVTLRNSTYMLGQY